MMKPDVKHDDTPIWFECEVCEFDSFHILEFGDYYHCSCALCGMVKIIKKG